MSGRYDVSTLSGPFRPVRLNGRLVQIVELWGGELRRAAEFGEWMAGRAASRGIADDDVQRGRAEEIASRRARRELHEIGAQGEIVVAKVLGLKAPLVRGSVGRLSPSIPPNWSVHTQLSTSRDTLDGYLRLMARNFRSGWRHVLVERDGGGEAWEQAGRPWGDPFAGSPVFIVHGWISDEHARDVAIQRYSYSTNRHVHFRHLLSPLDRVHETAHGAPTDEPPAPAPFDTDADAAAECRQLGFDDEGPQ